ncbi:MAG: endonuclease III domain-containing protein [Dehalococcoidia bacterium]
MSKPDIDLVLNRLIGAYGDRKWKRRLEPVGELVQTVLSQNTSDTNSRRAYKSLVDKFGSWHDIAEASTQKIADSIRTGGLADIKARYIKNALTDLEKQSTGFDLQFLKNMDVETARRWLLKLPGVGMKTASCVLLFSLGMPAFPVDTHVFRVAGRLGLIGSKLSANEAHLAMEKLVISKNIYRCHVLLIEHGRKTCKAQRPLCRMCVLADICPSYKLFVK